jgi:hypothetical protein
MMSYGMASASRDQLVIAVSATYCSSGPSIATEAALSSPCGKVGHVASCERVIAAQVVRANAAATGRAQQIAAPNADKIISILM